MSDTAEGVENNMAKILWDFKFETDKQLLPADSNIRKEHERTGKHQGLTEQQDSRSGSAK